jgi:hypothetical protein
MEIWKDIKGFEGSYQISNMGNVRSLDREVKSKVGYRKIKGMYLKFLIDKDGYHSVNLKKKQLSYKLRVHRLVCDAFIENIDNKPQVNHINGIKNDNRLINLEWASLSENRKHAYSTGLQNGINRRGEKNNFTKLTSKQVIEIRELYTCKLTGKKNKNGCLTMKEIAKMYGITSGAVQRIVSKKNWAWL